MTDRDMTYDLDGVFSTRNQGQLISSEVAQSRVIRTPGLAPVRKTLAGYVEAPAYAGTAGWMDDTTDLPLVGPVSNKMLLFGAVGLAGALTLFFVMKRKKG